jgi:hypothetical protein
MPLDIGQRPADAWRTFGHTPAVQLTVLIPQAFDGPPSRAFDPFVLDRFVRLFFFHDPNQVKRRHGTKASIVIGAPDHRKHPEAPGQAGSVVGAGPGEPKTLLGVMTHSRETKASQSAQVAHAGKQAAELTLAPVLEHQKVTDHRVRVLDNVVENVGTGTIAAEIIPGQSLRSTCGLVENVRRASVRPGRRPGRLVCALDGAVENVRMGAIAAGILTGQTVPSRCGPVENVRSASVVPKKVAGRAILTLGAFVRNVRRGLMVSGNLARPSVGTVGRLVTNVRPVADNL